MIMNQTNLNYQILLRFFKIMNDDITKLFLVSVNDSIEFQETIDIIQDNSSCNFWLIGGFIYRSIASKLYGLKKPKVDFDFIIEKPTEKILFPNSWRRTVNRYGNLKFIKNDGLEIDFVPLENVHSIIRRGLSPSIENFLTGTPLNIQSIAYDVKNKIIKGDVGIKALVQQIVAVNDFEQAKIYSARKGKLINNIIQEKALSLGFKSILVS